ncbi:mechanosensitive ion channel family protein [Candidatus Gracilibacteria bacterium]|nr:mechanosensitive ion channel family protein [Candidatus Gracilibacteria bacterium]MCF7856086.1 mechanosensitive ion channel family protein [Candidatus Gracilibacteria bacterium]MCF7896505.1 mechanosensitive ion channel family protein [Candidatus Gracilibacteria bacterium]
MNLSFVPTALAANTEETITVVESIPGFLVNIIIGGIGIVISFFLATFLRSWTQRIIDKKKIAQHEEMKVLYGRVVFSIILAVGIIISLTIVGAPLELFTGGVGLGIAFAFREILANFFAGMILLSNNKFNIGDYIMLDPNKDGSSSIAGTIVDIQSRATSLRSIDGGEITVPNTRMLNSPVKCFTKNPIRRHVIPIGVGYQTDIAAACELIRKTVTANANVQPKPPVTVLTKGINDSAVMLEARFWTISRSKWWIAKSEILREIFDTLQKAGIDIPYPIQTLRVDSASSDMLAQPNHLIDNLKKIKQVKTAVQEEVFRQTPNEAVATPQPVPPKATPAFTPQNT